MTTAEKIAKALGYDGHNFEGFEALVEQHNGHAVWKHGYKVGCVVRYDFPDESCIVECGSWWDIGLGDTCFCTVGACPYGQHADDCEAGLGEPTEEEPTEEEPTEEEPTEEELAAVERLVQRGRLVVWNESIKHLDTVESVCRNGGTLQLNV